MITKTAQGARVFFGNQSAYCDFACGDDGHISVCFANSTEEANSVSAHEHVFDGSVVTNESLPPHVVLAFANLEALRKFGSNIHTLCNCIEDAGGIRALTDMERVQE